MHCQENRWQDLQMHLHPAAMCNSMIHFEYHKGYAAQNACMPL